MFAKKCRDRLLQQRVQLGQQNPKTSVFSFKIVYYHVGACQRANVTNNPTVVEVRFPFCLVKSKPFTFYWGEINAFWHLLQDDEFGFKTKTTEVLAPLRAIKLSPRCRYASPVSNITSFYIVAASYVFYQTIGRIFDRVYTSCACGLVRMGHREKTSLKTYKSWFTYLKANVNFFCDFGLAPVTKGVVVAVCGVVRMAESLGLEGVVTTVTTFLFNKRGGVYIGQ